MKYDPDYNINFVALIERHPCLYDYTSSDYSRRNVQDKAWETIAKEISEKVEDCKDRWKNLRGCYTRYLKSSIGRSGSGAKTRKPYYLAEFLHFLQPYTKSRKQQGNILDTESGMSFPEAVLPKDDHNFTNTSDHEAEELTEYSQTETCASPSISDVPPEDNFRRLSSAKDKKHRSKHSISIEDVNKSPFEYFESRKGSYPKNDDPDLNFLKSILPDMKEMNTEQKRRFKIGIINLTGQILSESV